MPTPASFQLPKIKTNLRPQAFLPDQPRAAKAGRPLGGLNKLTRDLKAAIVDAAILHGDGRGNTGLVAYFQWLAANYPHSFSGLIGKMLPLTIESAPTVSMIGQVNIVAVPTDRYLSGEDIRKLAPQHTIEHAPQEPTPEQEDAA